MRQKHWNAPISHPGKPLDFTLSSFSVPIVNGALARLLRKQAAADVQIFELGVGAHEMYALNVTRALECLDEKKSEFIKWRPEDGRADRLGGYRQVTKLVLDPTAIPANAKMFRVKGWLVALVVSEELAHAMTRHGCSGAKFLDINPD
jgi:hypothetical protein